MDKAEMSTAETMRVTWGWADRFGRGGGGGNDQGGHSWWFRASRARDESRNNRNMRPSGWVTPAHPTRLASAVNTSSAPFSPGGDAVTRLQTADGKKKKKKPRHRFPPPNSAAPTHASVMAINYSEPSNSRARARIKNCHVVPLNHSRLPPPAGLVSEPHATAAVSPPLWQPPPPFSSLPWRRQRGRLGWGGRQSD